MQAVDSGAEINLNGTGRASVPEANSEFIKCSQIAWSNAVMLEFDAAGVTSAQTGAGASLSDGGSRGTIVGQNVL